MDSEIAQSPVVRVSGIGKVFPTRTAPWRRLWHAWTGRPIREGFRALSNVSFCVNRGETLGLIGKNGAGKSTLLQLICGTLHPTEGRIDVTGRVAALLELGAGFNPEFTGRENAIMNARLLGLSDERIRERLPQIEAFAEIGPFIDQPVKTYSSGMFVRLAFSVLAHVDADILIIDEALSVGDAYFTQKCMRFLHEFREHGTLIFVSHDTNAVLALCQRAVWIDGGTVREYSTAKEVCEHYLADLFGSRNLQKAGLPGASAPNAPTEELVLEDQRAPWINASTLRNDLEVFRFNPDAPRFGEGGATIEDVSICDEQGRPLAWVVGGERVQLKIRTHLTKPLAAPIIGFYLKDRLGQTLFGDNTWLASRELDLSGPSDHLEATFAFRMPFLPAGEYSIAAAIADGQPDEHAQHDWIHDALILHVQGNPVAGGLVGIPMQSIRMYAL